MNDPLYPRHQRIMPARHLARGEVVSLPRLPGVAPERADASIPLPTGFRRVLVGGRRGGRSLLALSVAALLGGGL